MFIKKMKKISEVGTRKQKLFPTIGHRRNNLPKSGFKN